MKERLSVITPEITRLSELCVKCGKIDPELYPKYDVKRGLRDINRNLYRLFYLLFI